MKHEYVHSCIHAVKYSPIVGGDEVCSDVVGIGRIGAWRLFHDDFTSTDLSASNSLSEAPTFQPEDFHYNIMEIACNTGKVCSKISIMSMCMFISYY